MPPTRTPIASNTGGRVYLTNSTRKHRIDERRLRRTARALLAALGEAGSTVAISLVGDRAIRRLNATHRGKDRATDVLSFSLVEHSNGHVPPSNLPHSASQASSGGVAAWGAIGPARDAREAGAARRAGKPDVRHAAPFLRERQLGDVVISLDTAARQAREYGVPLIREVERLLIHGLLHLLGHDHERPDERARMARAERKLARAIEMPWPEGYRSGL